MLLFAFALAAQPLPDDSPLMTAVKPPRVFEAQQPAPLKPVVPPPVAAPPVTPGALPLLREAITPPDAPLERKTRIDGDALQVVFGQRAVFLLAPEDGKPRLVAVEPGRLAVAHPDGQVRETFAPPPAGRLAAALDGSAEKGASYLKVWNGLDHAVTYRAQALVLRGGKILRLAAPVCALAPGEVRVQSWPSAIAAVSLSRFTAPEPNAINHAGCG